MQVWATKTRFEALSEVRGRIYTSQTDIGLQEIVGDELRDLPGGAAYKDSIKLYLHPYDERRILVSAQRETLTFYDGEQVTPFRPRRTTTSGKANSTRPPRSPMAASASTLRLVAQC